MRGMFGGMGKRLGSMKAMAMRNPRAAAVGGGAIGLYGLSMTGAFSETNSSLQRRQDAYFSNPPEPYSVMEQKLKRNNEYTRDDPAWNNFYANSPWKKRNGWLL